ncbi:hypothetical protein ACBQ10_22440 [Kluyvera intermedia]|uniref:hypothetical protein n=1 Tax=Kluyvera intermedia TaxID=61648 RepID=UPI003525278C
MRHLYYGSGHALSISLDDRLITEFTRDNLHREISRTQGSLTMRTRYDRLGRQERREIYRQDNGMRPAEAWHWQYDSRHNLLSETQISDYRYQGYHYDDGDYVRRHDTSFRGLTHYTYDAAGNLLTGSQAGGALTYNRQPQCKDGTCRYDVYGRMVHKPGPGGLWHYAYDSEHRMTEAVLVPMSALQVRCYCVTEVRAVGFWRGQPLRVCPRNGSVERKRRTSNDRLRRRWYGERVSKRASGNSG